MKHSKEWHTCDRCGAEVKELKAERAYFFKRNMRRADIKMRYSEKEGYLVGIKPASQENYTAEISEETRIKTKNFELCHKCRADFERFMKNEKITE